MIEFKSASKSDVHKIVQLLIDDFLGKTREDLSDLKPYQLAFEEIKKDPNQHLIVMLFDKEIIGTFHLTIIPSLSEKGQKRANIESVRIDKNFRDKGFGKQLINYAIKISKENGAASVQLTTNKARLDAKRFYEKLGFAASHEGMKLKIL